MTTTAIRWTGPTRHVIPSLGLTLEPGQPAEVPADVAAELLDRDGFERAAAPKVPTIDQVLADVGDDPVKAAVASEAEQARGGKARPKLIEALAAITAPHGDD